MFAKKLSVLLFLSAIGVAILSGAFSVPASAVVYKTLFLIIAGVIVGLINIVPEEEFGFLVCSVAFIIATRAILPLIEASIRWINISNILNNMIVFFAPAAIVVSLKLIIEYLSEIQPSEEVITEVTTDKEHIWNMVILVAVTLTIVTLILSMFFDIRNYAYVISIIDYIVLIIFIADLFVLYRKAYGFTDFLKKDWLDIIAVIPFGTAMRLAKLVRFIRIMKIMSKTSKVGKVAKVGVLGRIGKFTKLERATRSMKYFSPESGFSKYILDEEGSKRQRKRRR